MTAIQVFGRVTPKLGPVWLTGFLAAAFCGTADSQELVFKNELVYAGLKKPNGRVAVVQIDSVGDFVPEHGLEDIDPSKPYAGPKYTVINEPRKPNEVVYEYRSGSLVRGTFNKDYKFVPERGSKVISFKDYRPGSDAVRIYNLPGRFVPQSEVNRE